ncbi:MAG: PD40 domain-containing protein, partial [Chloroflexi bacterium]|nr:PD40 domain-containing protein [Chloroflexota bacterium]
VDGEVTWEKESEHKAAEETPLHSGTYVGGFPSLTFTTEPGTVVAPHREPWGTTIAYMTCKPDALERPFDIGSVSRNGADITTMATGPNSGIGIAGELAWVGTTGKLMTNERVGIHSYMTFDTAQAPFTRTTNVDDDAFTRNLIIPGGQGGDGLAVSRNGETVMWMIRNSHDPSSYVVDVRIAEISSLTGQSANDAGRVLFTHSAATDGPDFNRGFGLSADGEVFVVSLKSGAGYDLFLMDSTSGEEIEQLTNTGASAGEHNLYPEISPDGEWVAFSSQSDSDGRADIAVVKADGTSFAKVTDTVDVSEMRPSWSPEGMEVAYQGQDYSEANPNWDIYRVPVFGGASAR